MARRPGSSSSKKHITYTEITVIRSSPESINFSNLQLASIDPPMAGQVMEAHQAARLQPPTMSPFAPLPHNTCKHDVHHHLTTTTTTTAMAATSGSTNSNVSTGAAAADMAAYLQQLQDAAAAAEAAKTNGGTGGAARGEQCPRCASHDTKFCYYNNYNTSQPRHFCRACRRYWTLGGSLRNVPIGGSTRKRPRLAHHHHQHAHARRAPAANAFGGLGLPAPMMPPLQPSSSSQGQGGGGLLGSLFALGAAGPLLEGRGAGASSFDFDLGLGLPTAGPLHLGAGAGEAAAVQMQGLGFRGGGAGSSSSFLWPAGLMVDNDSVDTWKMPPSVGAGSMWPDFSAATAVPHTGGMLHGGGHLM